MKPLGFDAFCGAGGCTRGYQNAGFEMWGCDINAQPNYCGERFIRGDAVELLADAAFMAQFVFAHASPPCQAHTSLRSLHKERSYPDLIAPTRDLLEATGLPYVIENVEGARAAMRDPSTICGSSLGLRVRRHRLFETNWTLMAPPCAHGQQGQPVGVYGQGSSKGQLRGKKASTEAEVLEVMGMPWADRKTATQAIPPAYTELIGHQLMQHLRAVAA